MKTLILLISISIFGGIGWWLASDFGLMTGYFASLVGSLLGVYVGVKISRYLQL